MALKGSHPSFYILDANGSNDSYAAAEKIPSLFADVRPLSTTLTDNDDNAFIFRTQAFRRSWAVFLDRVETHIKSQVIQGAEMAACIIQKSSLSGFREVPLILAYAGVSVMDHSFVLYHLSQRLALGQFCCARLNASELSSCEVAITSSFMQFKRQMSQRIRTTGPNNGTLSSIPPTTKTQPKPVTTHHSAKTRHVGILQQFGVWFQSLPTDRKAVPFVIVIEAAENSETDVVSSVIRMSCILRQIFCIPISIILGISTSVRYVEDLMGSVTLAMTETTTVNLFISRTAADNILKTLLLDPTVTPFLISGITLRYLDAQFKTYHFSVTMMLRDLYVIFMSFYQMVRFSYFAIPLTDITTAERTNTHEQNSANSHLAPQANQVGLATEDNKGVGELAEIIVHGLTKKFDDSKHATDLQFLIEKMTQYATPNENRQTAMLNCQRPLEALVAVKTKFGVAKAEHRMATDFIPKSVAYLYSRRIAFTLGLQILHSLYAIFPISAEMPLEIVFCLLEDFDELLLKTAVKRGSSSTNAETSLLARVSSLCTCIRSLSLSAHANVAEQFLSALCALQTSFLSSNYHILLSALHAAAGDNVVSKKVLAAADTLDLICEKSLKLFMQRDDGDTRVVKSIDDGSGGSGIFSIQSNIFDEMANWIEQTMKEILFFPLLHHHPMSLLTVTQMCSPSVVRSMISPNISEIVLKTCALFNPAISELRCKCCPKFMYDAGEASGDGDRKSSAKAMMRFDFDINPSLEDFTIMYRLYELFGKKNIDLMKYFCAFCHFAWGGGSHLKNENYVALNDDNDDKGKMHMSGRGASKADDDKGKMHMSGRGASKADDDKGKMHMSGRGASKTDNDKGKMHMSGRGASKTASRNKMKDDGKGSNSDLYTNGGSGNNKISALEIGRTKQTKCRQKTCGCIWCVFSRFAIGIESLCWLGLLEPPSGSSGGRESVQDNPLDIVEKSELITGKPTEGVEARKVIGDVLMGMKVKKSFFGRVWLTEDCLKRYATLRRNKTAK